MSKNEKKEKKEKSGKGAGVGAAIAALILLLGGGAWGTGLLPGGGNGNGPFNNENNNPSATEVPKDDNNINDNQVERTVVIMLEQSDITVNGEACDSVAAMNDKIKQLYTENSKTTFEFKENFSIKSVYEEVVSALKNTEALLKIDIKGID